MPLKTSHQLKNTRVKDFVGSGHVWRMEAWKTIPNYPPWFVFYGEEEFASYELFKTDWKIWFVPEVLIQHRVDIKGRKQERDYSIRLRRSLIAGWCLYFIFYPIRLIPKKFFYTFMDAIKAKSV